MRWLLVAAVVISCVAGVSSRATALTSPADVRIAFIPLDDRPAASRFPQEIAAICGASVEMPPASALGHFQRPGDVDAIARWLTGLDDRGLSAVVLSSDMVAYGGLVASRTASTPLSQAMARVDAIARFHRSHPQIPVYVFGSVMRLAPTTTAAAQAYVDALTIYAQNGGGPPSSLAATARATLPNGVFWDYVGSRARDLAVDERLLTMVSDGDISILSLTQDDAGAAAGLQIAEEHRLRSLEAQLGIGKRVLLNPGTDEMGIVMVMRAIEDAVGWSPTVSVTYPSAASASNSDPLEYLPIRQTVSDLAAFLGMRQQPDADFELAVNVPDAAAARDAFAAALERRLDAGAATAVADVSFISQDESLQPLLAQSLELHGVAAAPIAFASWNTTANTTGTALAEASATLMGRRFGTLSQDAAATFLYERYVDDYAYRLLVRPSLQARLLADGADVYALGDRAQEGESLARGMLWPLALSIFARDFAPEGDRLGALSIYLPWQRTFEVRLDASVHASGVIIRR